MNFSQAEAYLNSTITEAVSRHEPYRLDRMRAFLRELGDPQNAYPTVHVGGTSGKGSTATMLAAILQADGKRVGLHTKPHVRSVTERARIDGVNIPDERFAELLSEMLPAIDRVASQGRPSYYETLLALTFLYFARDHVDAAVIEVGIGGTLDGTNVILPEVSVITTIGLDHTEILGNTLEEIADDKAGIAKPGVPLVSAVASAGARAVIERRCREVGAPFVSVLDTTTVIPGETPAHGQHFTVETPLHVYEIDLPMLGGFQRMNAATAIRAIEEMNARGDRSRLHVAVDAIERGLAAVALAGRMELFPGHPSVVFDIAHNPEKAANLMQGLREHFPGRRVHFVIAIGETKDAREILGALMKDSENPASFIFTLFSTQGRHPTKPQRLAHMIEEFGAWGRAIDNPVEALQIARRQAAADDLVVVTGSTFIVAELREWWFENVATETTLR